MVSNRVWTVGVLLCVLFVIFTLLQSHVTVSSTEISMKSPRESEREKTAKTIRRDRPSERASDVTVEQSNRRKTEKQIASTKRVATIEPIRRSISQLATSEIRQIYIGDYLQRAFANPIFRRTKLKQYGNVNAPAFFYGLGSRSAFADLQRHRSYAVIIFTGGDASIALTANTNALGILQYARQNPDRVMSISIANFIAETLTEYKVPFVKFPFYPPGLIPAGPAVTKGNGVYVYGSDNLVYHHDVVMNEIRPFFPNLTFFFSTHCYRNDAIAPPGWKCYPRQDLWKTIYPQCFIGIRLTRHDGLAATVQELGSLGIRTVWNGGTPSAIPWRTTKDVIDAIAQESKKIGTKDEELAMRVRKFLEITPQFYQLKTYFPNVKVA